MEYVLLAILLSQAIVFGVFCSYIAAEKGRPGSSWFWLGFFFSLLAVLALIAVPKLVVNRLPPAASAPLGALSFGGALDISLPKYQLFLTRRFDIQRNNTLGKFVIDDEVFASLEDSLQVAHSRYLTQISESAEVIGIPTERLGCAPEDGPSNASKVVALRRAEQRSQIANALGDSTGKLINVFDVHRMTPIMSAIQLRDVNLVSLLINAGARQNQMYDDRVRGRYLSIKDLAREAGPEVMSLFDR
jgi:hypothetical protein